MAGFEAMLIDRLKTQLNALHALRSENVTVLNALESSMQISEATGGAAANTVKTTGHFAREQLAAEKANTVRQLVARLDAGIQEAEALINVAQQLISIENDKAKTRSQVKQLCDENASLRGQLTNSQEKLQASEQTAVELECEREQLSFMNDLNTALTRAAGDDSGIGLIPSITATPDSEEGVARDLDSLLGFPDDHSFNSTNSRGAASFLRSSIASGTDGGQRGQYEIPARLRTLHNLVIQYASQGRYEVAVPLCKQALEDLEKASGREHPDVATMLNILALVYRDQQKYREAAHLLNEALGIRCKTLGEWHPAVAATLNNLAVLYGQLPPNENCVQCRFFDAVC